ncbi:MAG: MFS transporter [Bacillota bacterium]|nr:MFS transporter [Bacillota bacterium]
MDKQKITAQRYKWVVLFAFMITMFIQQLLWITFAAITDSASVYYGVSDLSIGLLSMVFMIVYIIISIPASWMIDTYGFRVAVGLGAVLTGVFGILRGVFASSFIMVLVCQIGIALGQPLIINAVTKVAARWFPVKERGTASGLSWLAGYVGLIVGLAFTPYLSDVAGIPGMLYWYGILSVAAAVIFLLLARENKQKAQSENEEKVLVFDGLKKLLLKKDFILLTIVFFIGLGVFNGLSTWIENVLKPRGFSSYQAGIIGGVMVACGVLGSGIMPVLSDKFKNRTRFVILALAGSVPGLIGITYGRSYWLVLTSAGILGFFMLSTAPIGFQYGSEIAYPAPEGTSTGVLMQMGQISGIVFIFGMDMFKSAKTGSMGGPMIVLIILLILGALLSTRLKESDMLREKTDEDVPAEEKTA